MAEDVVESVAGEGGGAVESPPAAPQPLRVVADEPRARLHQLAERLMRGRGRQLLVEYLQLRRSLM